MKYLLKNILEEQRKESKQRIKKRKINFFTWENYLVYSTYTNLYCVYELHAYIGLYNYNRIKNAKAFSIFKKTLKTMLTDCPFYSLTEFFNRSLFV